MREKVHCPPGRPLSKLVAAAAAAPASSFGLRSPPNSHGLGSRHLILTDLSLMGPGCTEDSFSMAFGVNHLGHFLLTNLLLKRMQQCGPSRIVNVSALLHRLGNIDFSLLASKQDLETSQSIWHNFQDYCNSKLCNVLFTRELANMLECSNVTCYSLHPGIIYTELCRNMSMWQQFLLMPFAKLFFLDPEGGSQTTLYCALQEGIEALSGRYFSNCALQQVGYKGRDDALAKKLWEVSAGSGDCRKRFLSAPILSSVSKFTAIIGFPANREFVSDSAELTDCTPLLNISVTY
ncbi:retinol dehydrogenase 11-like isoform X6 [Syngnathus acus]|uniref:retinol dehydrogenase 11-like isoform X6 n=1 Tax=Syngnathus acus TaxID=161584 RepID=UPI0018860C29|nr:retinol dehydrogenase 11-like isoform X6 [Syngnathus acus]